MKNPSYNSTLLANTPGIDILERLPKGPDYIDDALCRCSLQAVNVQLTDHNNEVVQEAWRCTGNSTTNAYFGTSGKWFTPTSLIYDGLDFAQAESWAENPPDLSTTYYLQGSEDRSAGTFLPILDSKAAPISSEDQSCTGQNSTEYSARYYAQIQKIIQTNQTELHQTCITDRKAQAIDLGNSQNFTIFGCPLGFLCQNSSALVPPQYCPPVLECQMSKLAGTFCPIPMGYFEPEICPQSFYCPQGGKIQLPCPEGSFCPVGSYQPQRCSPGARCPQGSYYNQSYLPLILLVVVDVLLLGLLLFFKLRSHFIANRTIRKASAPASRSLLKRTGTIISDLTIRNQAYRSLYDEEIPLEARITSFNRSPTGFMAAMEPDFAYTDEYIQDEKPSSELQLFVQSLSRCMDTTKIGLSFDFEDLQFRPKTASRDILSEVTGSIPRGSFCAIMGGSGAGKSTFVNVLMGKARHTGGTTKVNGIAGAISKYKKVIGYVPQDDIVLPELTVRENILHSARIRLPATWSDAEVQSHVDILLACLQLSHVKDSLVGSPAAPVISGGQRKRVSIGMELAAAPMALFLDEPTSGLDATSASSIMQLLKALSKIGITIVAIVHQPRQEIYESLDEIILLGQGRMLFQGTRTEVQTYFEQLGFTWPLHANPADVIMDIIAGQGMLYKKIGDTSLESLINNWKTCHSTILARRTHSASDIGYDEIIAIRNSIARRGSYWWSQLYFCFLRSILQQWRNKSNFFFEIGTAMLAGLLGGLTQNSAHGDLFRGFFHDPYTILGVALNYGAILHMSLLVGLSLGLTAASPGVKLFGEEKLVYWREAASGHNRFGYYMGKVLSSIPRIIFASLHFTVFFYILATPIISWGSSFISNLLYYYAIYGLASTISMLCRRENGPLLAVLAALVVGFLNGMAPTLQTVTTWHLGWLWQASPGVWLAEAYFTSNLMPLDYLYKIDHAAGYTGYTLDRFGVDLTVVFMIGTAYRVLAFAAMIGLNRTKQR